MMAGGQTRLPCSQTPQNSTPWAAHLLFGHLNHELLQQLHDPVCKMAALGSRLLKWAPRWIARPWIPQNLCTEQQGLAFALIFLSAAITRHPLRAHSSWGACLGSSDEATGGNKILHLCYRPWSAELVAKGWVAHRPTKTRVVKYRDWASLDQEYLLCGWKWEGSRHNYTSSFESVQNVLRLQNGKLESDLLQKVQNINLNLRTLSNAVLSRLQITNFTIVCQW